MRPFPLEVPQAAIADLHARLDRVRWPDEVPDSPWLYGHLARVLALLRPAARALADRGPD